MKTAVTLCRVSSREQAEGFSLAAQDALLKEYCQNNKIQITQSFSFSESAAGKSRRIKYREMIDYVLKNGVNYIVVEKTDRLLRNLSDYAEIKRIVFEHSIEIHFVKEREILSNKSNSHVKQVFGFKALLADGYIENLSEESAKGLKQKAEEGLWPHKPPYGYTLRDKDMIPHKDEARVIRDVVGLYLNGKSINQIRDHLNAMGVRRRRGHQWSKSQVHRILTLPLYTGRFDWKGKRYKGAYEPLITDIEHAQILEMISRPPTQKHRWPFSGMLQTFKSRRMTGELQKGIMYYSGYISRDEKLYIREDRLLEQIGAALLGIQFCSEIADQAAQIAREIIADTADDSNEKMQKAQKDQRDVLYQSNRLLDLYLSGGIDQATYLDRSSALKYRQKETEAAINALVRSVTSTREKIEKIIFSLRDLPALYPNGTPQEKAELAKTFIEKITVNIDKSINVHWAEPWCNFAEPLILSFNKSTVRKKYQMRGLRDAIRTTIYKLAA